ncbi:MAG: flagellar hook assembly protein FlgD [Rhodoferax sp.]|nr:flagellar hook assembly protein FlgD [Rhodoferax sp.]MBP9928252.1 flagellar hook assembly protein FlgD [Rhodoferax sp.]HQX58410.1 flagellar hook capping FlgD N-terminal domain-containing protein [Burkholderiaceae bacterium]HQZ08191.1 flagellar hook capping FlgD N-terminal domain-containing protein [Burkholderiaceae bacterium]HRA61451.1 flagellar hook capping FlgD N-terminal domain-containing protein [Burkholderiaceae bacterium]
MSSTTAIAGTSSTAATSSTTTSSTNQANSEDRFLKLLVAQLANQDPMNPMDNAQMTSQMAQISTVSSIEKTNASLAGLAGQLAAMQTLQAGSLVGRDVLVEGNRLPIADGKATGAIDLDLPADKVVVEVLSAGGQVLESFNLGALKAGRNSFEWDATTHTNAEGLSYRVTATQGKTVVTHRTLVQDAVVSVGSDNGLMQLQLRHLGNVGYDTVKTIF